MFINQEPTSQVVNVKVPTGSAKLAKADISKLATRKFKYSEISTQYQNVYSVGDMLIGIKDFRMKAGNEQTLVQKKAEMSAMHKELKLEDNIDRLEIVKVNGINFLIQESHLRGEHNCTFFSETRNNRGVNGSVQFQEADSIKGRKIFDELLKSISFKSNL
ncbi:hypothetical protein ASU31_24065 [Pedobacter ginsenosidimutans]|uniref:Uncharacterized protein n=2 Tax=Pedobacter ginsenosidimutans TaxID=687842 RepID=A0A0T5VI80_9SPHI|nr:hypothetical protein ASU31_24065 [Pedobacter ginsenosidimutans]